MSSLKCWSCDTELHRETTCFLDNCDCKCHVDKTWRKCDTGGCKNHASFYIKAGRISKFSCIEQTCVDRITKWVLRHARVLAKAGPFDLTKQVEQVKGG